MPLTGSIVEIITNSDGDIIDHLQVSAVTLAKELWRRTWPPVKAGLIAAGLAALGYVTQLVTGISTQP